MNPLVAVVVEALILSQPLVKLFVIGTRSSKFLVLNTINIWDSVKPERLVMQNHNGAHLWWPTWSIVLPCLKIVSSSYLIWENCWRLWFCWEVLCPLMTAAMVGNMLLLLSSYLSMCVIPCLFSLWGRNLKTWLLGQTLRCRLLTTQSHVT